MFNCCIKPTRALHSNFVSREALQQSLSNIFGLKTESEKWNNTLQASFNCQKDCWICYNRGNVENLCACKNLKTHKKCLAKMAIQKYGKT